MNGTLDTIGRVLARYLDREEEGYEPFTPSDPDALRATLQPGDVLLIEGNTHISGVIKYLTQSTWSHAALYVGPIGERTTMDGEPAGAGRGHAGRRRGRRAAVESTSVITPASAGRSA